MLGNFLSLNHKGTLKSILLFFKKHEFLAVFVFLSLIIIIFFYDIVFLNKTFLTPRGTAGVMGDDGAWKYSGNTSPRIMYYYRDAGASAWQSLPLTQKIHDLYFQRIIPLWNPNQGMGKPLAADMLSAPFYPSHIPLFISPTPVIWDIYFLSRFLFAGFFAYLFTRLVGLNKISSFISAVVFMFSGYFILYPTISHLDVDILVPFVLYAFERLIQKQTIRNLVFAGSAIALSILGGMPESTFLLVFFAFCYFAWRAVTNFFHTHDIKELTNHIKHFLLSLAIGMGLSAFLILPFLEFLQNAFHTHPTTAYIGLHYDPIKFLVSLFIPYFNGAPWGNLQGTGWSGIRNYIGITTLVLSIFAFFKKERIKKLTIFFLIAVFFGLAKIYGAPILNLIGYLPGFVQTGFPKYFAPEVSLSFAVLAGFGIDYLLSVKKINLGGVFKVFLFAAPLLTILLLLNRDVLFNLTSFSHHLRHIGFASFILLAAFIFSCLSVTGVIKPKGLAGLLILLVLVELFVYLPRKGRLTRYDPFTKPPYIEFLQDDKSNYRVFGLDRLFYPNSASAYNIDDIRDLDGLYVKRYFNYIKNFLNPSIVDRYTGAPETESKENLPTKYWKNDFFDLLGTKYILSYQGLYEAYDHSFIDKVLSQNSISPAVRLSGFSINKVDKPVLFQHPPSEIAYNFTPSEEQKYLVFSLGMDPQVWLTDKDDGVLFEIYVQTKNFFQNTKLFSRWVDPKNNPEDRKWHSGFVNLSPYINQELTLILVTSPGKTSAWDWAGWGNLNISNNSDYTLVENGQFELIYDDEIKIYKNSNAFPRAFIVRNIKTASNQDETLLIMKGSDFNPREEAVIEGQIPQILIKSFKETDRSINNDSSVKITKYKANLVEMETMIEKPGLLVFSDTYYPGWEAYVNGKRGKIYPTNYAFRGVLLKSGENKIKFVYNPPTFRTGVSVSIVTLLSLTTISLVDRHNRRKRNSV